MTNLKSYVYMANERILYELLPEAVPNTVNNILPRCFLTAT